MGPVWAADISMVSRSVTLPSAPLAAASDPSVFRDAVPVVSVCIPMLNEMGAIEACLDAFEAQSYPLDRLDLIVVDGGSSDGSRQYVEARAATSGLIRVVDNPRRKAAAAFNCGLDAARGEVFCLFSSHGIPDPAYVDRSVAVLAETGATGVGGRYHHVGTDRTSNAVGRAMVSPVGMASPHRFASERIEVDTISHPAYRAVHLAGMRFDESLERNADYEFNWRLRRAGRTLLFDPSVESVYRPRPSLQALARQFWWYGRWKERVIRRNPGSLRPRHVIAPVFAASLATAPLLACSRAGRTALALEATAYATVVAAGVIHGKTREHDTDPRLLAACFPVMHACWGAGFLTSFVEDALRRERST